MAFKKKTKHSPAKGSANLEPWVGVQTRVYTNWINDKLKGTRKSVSNLSKDLTDGLILIELLELLSGKKITGKIYAKPSRSSHRGQNLTTVFTFMKDEEELPIINITPNQIQEGEIVQILNLIWHLIMRYQITDSGSGSRSLLLKWLKSCLPGREITNFTTDWRDGFLLSSLINFCDSSLIIDHLWLDGDESLENVSNAMKIAKDSFGIPQLLEPEDFVTEKADENSIMTYLSYFCHGPDSPGQKMLLEWIQDQTSDETISDFGDVWANGKKLELLLKALLPEGFQETSEEEAVKNCMECASTLLGVEMTVTPDEFAEHDLNPMIRIAYLVQFLFGCRVKVHEVHIPEDPGTGALAWVDVSLPIGSNAIVEGLASGKLAGEVPVEVEETGNKQYRVQFNTEIPDEYTLHVSVPGMIVRGSPFIIDLSPPDPQSVEISSSILPKKAGIPVILTLKARNNLKPELLTVKATGDKTEEEVPSLVDMVSPGSYKVSFVPLQSDSYNVDIKLDGQHIKDSPFIFALNDLIQPEKVMLGTPVKTKIGEPVIIPIDSSACGDATLFVKCSGKEVGNVEVSYNPPENPTEITFIPPMEDIYSISIYYDATEIIDSPVVINFCSNAKKVQLSRPPLGSLKTGHVIQIGFDTSEAGNGELTASCSGKTVGDVEIKVIQNSEYDYDVAFTPPEGDIYGITVLWADEPVPGSPFNINLIPKDAPDAAKCKMIGIPKSSDLLLTHEAIEFTVDATDAGNGFLDIDIEMGDIGDDDIDATSIASTAVTESEFGNQSFVQDDDAESKLDVGEEAKVKKAESQESVGNTKLNEANGKLVQETSTVVEGGEKKIENGNLEFEESIEASVEEEKTGNALVMESAQGAHEQEEPQAQLNIQESEENPQIYNVTYVPVQKGEQFMNLTWSDQSIPGNPLTLNIVDPQIFNYGSPVSIEFKTRYKRKNLKVKIEKRDGSKVNQQVKMDKIKAGHYILNFTPSEVGVYLMNVSAKGKPIKGSPFIAKYVKPDVPKEECVMVKGLEEPAYIGKPFSFLIKTVDETLLKDLSVTRILSKDTDSDTEPLSVRLQKNADNSLCAVYTPSHVGEEIISVNVGGTPIRGSPFKLTVKEEPIKEKEDLSPVRINRRKGSSIVGMNLSETRFVVDEPYELKFYCKELGEGELVVLCKPTSHAGIEIREDESQEKTFWTKVTPKKPGKTELLVRFAGEDVFGSPFDVTFLPRGNAKKCTLLEASDCQQDLDEEEKMVCVSTKGAGKGQITAIMKSLITNKNIPVKVEHYSKHHYHLKFIPNEGLNYTLAVRFDDVDIKGSPYKILLGNPSFCTIEGEGVVRSWSGKWSKFIVDTENGGHGDLTVVVEADDEGDFDQEMIKLQPRIEKIADYKHEISYQPTKPGLYWVTVKLKNINIPGSPFRVPCLQPLNPNELSVADPVLTTYQGKHAEMQVAVDRIIEEDDKLTVSVHADEDEKCQGEVKRKDDQGYVFSFQLSDLGIHSVHVLWDGEHITGSPFEVSNILPPQASEFAVEAAEGDSGAIAVKVKGPPFSFRYGQLSSTVERSGSSENIVLPVDINIQSDTLCEVDFKPNFGGEYLLNIFYEKQHIQGSPFNLISTDASLCYSKGQGLVSTKISQPNKFSVFTENGGPGELRVEIEGEIDDEGDIMVTPDITQHNTRYDVTYVPSFIGLYRVSIFWDVQHIPGSPFEVSCCDPSRYSIPKPPVEGSLGKPIKIGVLESSTAPSFEKLSIYAVGKDHVHHNGEVSKGDDGNYLCTIEPPELGKYLVHIQCNNFDIEGSPFKIKNMPAPIPEKVIVSGPGIENGVIGQKGTFQIDVSEAGHGFIHLKVQGPKDGFKINLSHNPDNEYVMMAEYNPIHAGKYFISVSWSGVEVPNSPFTVNIGESTAKSAERESE